MTRLPGGREPADEVSEDVSLDVIFNEDDSDVAEDASDSDGFLYEESSCPPVAESKSEINLEDDNSGIIGMSMHNSKIYEELAAKKKTLDKLKKKDPEFDKFLASYKKGLEMSQDEHMDSDEDETGDHGMQLMDEDSSVMNKGNVLTNSIINSWSQLVKEEHNEFALTSLLNAYRAACHYGAESISVPYAASCQRIQNSETFCSILLFMLNEADNVFRSLLKIHSSSFKKEILLDLKNTSKWKSLQPLVKSYLRSTLFLLNQVTDLEILVFSLNRLRASIIFFAPFQSLLHRLIKVSVHLWATGQGVLSSCSFLVLRDLAVAFSLECFDICFTKTYKAYISRCKVVDSVNSRHIQFLRNSLVELCSLDVHKSCNKAFVSIQHLAKILKQGLRTKKKDALKKICSWQCANCIDLWVTFIAANICDYDLHHVFYAIVQLINGVACLFPGPRYFPLRIKCIQWLNLLSSSSGIFIPVASFVLDVLEYKTGKDGGKQGKSFNFSSVLKLPKHLLKSQDFQKECVTSAVELLSVHFSQWSCHISFPELATVPIIRLRKFHETARTESLKRGVKRLIDQVEQNVEFVQRKRDEVAFSPKDQQSVELFLQLEKCSLNAPFMQYYRSVIQKAASKNLGSNSI
ncbi:protein REBELOTE isoform X2 [Diospyros lotus]|nr:protein REBELOTE isoform X2 [Diospyros lotus]